MSVWEIIIGIVLIVFSLIIIGVVLLQEGRQANLGAISGAADSFMEKGKAAPWMPSWQVYKVIAITFFVLVFIGMLITKFT